jgi:prolyl 4-hydroxylase
MESLEEPCKVMEGFLDPQKCQHLIDTYQHMCKRSTVVDAAGKDVVDGGRTSSTYFLPDEDPVVKEIRARACKMAGVPESHCEGLQLVRYAKGEQYKWHYDWYDAISSNQREHTFLVYLNDFDMEDGGSTMFKHYAMKVYPRTGRCVWFRNMIDGKVNDKSMHSGEEVQSDKIKYAINVWIREKPVREGFENPPSTEPTDVANPPDVSKPTELPLWAMVLGIILFVLAIVGAYFLTTQGKLPGLFGGSMKTLLKRFQT